jgi:phosphoglycerate kinase
MKYRRSGMSYSKIITKDALKSRNVLVRVDFNVPMENGVAQDNSRIKNALPTIKFLKEAGAKIILLSHLGSTASRNHAQSLKNILNNVADECESKIAFVEDCLSENAHHTIKCASDGDIILMENLRFYPEEEKCDLDFAKCISSLGDFYINEAFSASHRKHASIFAVPKFLPHAFGLSFANEIQLIDNFFDDATSHKMGIIGGAKLSTKINLLKKLVKNVDKLALGGSIAVAFLSHFKKLPKCPYSSDVYAEEISQITENAKKYGCELVMPVDFLIADAKQRPCLMDASDVDTASIFDIGPRSVELFKHHLRECKIALWNGPMGMFEKEHYDQSTISLAQEISSLSKNGKLISIICGGDTTFAMNKFNVSQHISHVSTAGGALLSYLSDSELPGILAMTDPYVLQRDSIQQW